MSNLFHVGEIAIFITAGGRYTSGSGIVKYSGMECEVINELGSNTHPDGTLQLGIKFSDGVEAWCVEPSLRKLPPPEQLGSWSEIESLGWKRPAEETV